MLRKAGPEKVPGRIKASKYKDGKQKKAKRSTSKGLRTKVARTKAGVCNSCTSPACKEIRKGELLAISDRSSWSSQASVSIIFVGQITDLKQIKIDAVWLAVSWACTECFHPYFSKAT